MTADTGKQGSALREPAAPYSWLWLFVSAAVIWADMVTKEWAATALTLYRPREIFSWLNLTLAHNYGAAFSFLSEASGWQRWFFATLAAVISLTLVVWVLRLPRRDWRTAFALSLVIGGAIGNLVDRIRYGYVIDFIDAHYAGWHWPAFNVADSAITCGVILLLLDALLQVTRRTRKPT